MRLTEKNIGILLVVVGLIWLAISLIQFPTATQEQSTRYAEQKSQKMHRTSCKVLTVYDGDTLACDLNGNRQIDKPKEQVRLLGIDSPEMHYSHKNKTHDSQQPVDEPWAQESSRWLEKIAYGEILHLEFDLRKQDRYGRTLAFVFPSTPISDDVISLNEHLLALGYAKALFIGNNRRYEQRFMTVEAHARKKRLGLWGDHPSVKVSEDSVGETADLTGTETSPPH